MKKAAAIILLCASILPLCACGNTVEYIEIPHEVEKIVTVEVPVEVEKIVEVPVEVQHTTVTQVPKVYTREELIRLSGIEIPEGFIGNYENGMTVYLFAKDNFSYLRSAPADDRSNAIGRIYYYFETQQDKTDPEHILSCRITVGHSAVSFGTYGNFSLILWNGRYGWVKNTAVSYSPTTTGTKYTVEIKN